MGGLVVKSAFIIGHKLAGFQATVERVRAIFFLATPHLGAAIAQTLDRFVRLVSEARPFIGDLNPHSQTLRNINEDFPGASGKLHLVSFHESLPMGIFNTLIVEKHCASMNLPNERSEGLNANHRTVCKYASQDDRNYITVRNALATYIRSQRENNKAEIQTLALQVQARLNNFLGIRDAPEHEIESLDHLWLPGSYQWLATKPKYLAWRNWRDRRLLWFQARPGAGKTVLSRYIVSDLRKSDLDCCFFSFSAQDSTKSTKNEFLRSATHTLPNIVV